MDQVQSTSAMPAALRVMAVRFAYAATTEPAKAALQGVDLTIPAGQSVALLGPNGSGKSTFMKLIAGLLPADAGTIQVLGSTSPAQRRASMGMVFQHAALDRHMTVLENLRDQASLYGLSRREARQVIDDELRRGGLQDRGDALVKTLSGGLARRVDLIRAMLHGPRLLLLDEPTVGLDPAAREAFLSHLEELRRQRRDLSILMSTHLIDEADRQDRVALMHRGRIVADDAPAALRQQAGDRQVTVMDGRWTPPVEQREQWARRRGGWTRSWRQGQDDAAMHELLLDLARAAVPFTVAPPTLADVFEQLTGAALEEGADTDAALHSTEAAA